MKRPSLPSWAHSLALVLSWILWLEESLVPCPEGGLCGEEHMARDWGLHIRELGHVPPDYGQACG